MVRVGGGWDTLRGFLMKYDPLRVLQFTTLEQKILAFQKGAPGVGSHHSNTAPPPPPDMDPLSAFNLISSSSSSSSTSSSSSVSACKPPPVASAGQTCRSYAASPSCTPTLPRKCLAVTAKKAKEGTPSPRKPNQLPLPITTKGSSSLPSSPVVFSKQSSRPGCQRVLISRRDLTPSSAPSPTPADPSPASKLKVRPSPNSSASQPRSPVCPEPSSKCPKPSSPCTSPSASSVPHHVNASVRTLNPKDARPPTGASQRARLAQRRPGSPASRLRLEAARRARTTTKGVAIQTPTRTPTPSSRTLSPALPKPNYSLPKGREVPVTATTTAKAKGPAQSKVTPASVPRQVLGTGISPVSRVNQKTPTPATAQRVGRKQVVAATKATDGKSSLKTETSPGSVLAPQEPNPKIKVVKTEPIVSKKMPQCNSKSGDPYFEMSSRRRKKT